MAMKLAFVVLASLVLVSGNEKLKRQAPEADLAELFNKFKEQMKPIVGGFPGLPNGGSGSGSFPSFPNLGGSTGSGSESPSKREVSPKTFSEWFSQLGGLGGGNSLTGSLPFKPSSFLGQLPFGGSSGSTESPNQES